ncbi:CAP domain-containing protein [Chengkuizengella axinellae]|uniref:CAP domain-containing protein n=1 Tax=Chengkuizengella axinellae TaxID=3064388 RepID=A0ABT9J2W5_9BACL|nr:CAP domain-containing protein [Chengkuizengella sp. 2205SS18-9]MDP5275962.1 CAP domain-containing protein [Chengkuizengella sp. 2205SS18-9]
MKKGMFLSIAAATALLVSSTGINSADASQLQVKTYKVGSQLSQAEMNQMIEKAISQVGSQYNINIDELMKQVEQGNYAQGVKTPKVVAQPNYQAPAQPTQTTEAPEETTTTENETTNEEASDLADFEQQVVDLTNAERAKYGLAPLEVDLELSEVAEAKSADMQSRGYFDHNSPTYGSPFDMMTSFGISYTSAAENIAYGQQTPEEVVNAWMNSEGHRKNILSSSYTHIGVGYVEEGDYWTQMFIGK